jgi:uncharacterized membrane protein YraQ (UPF0718 family)
VNAKISDFDRFLVIFPSIVFEALPFVIIGALISGALEEFLPQQLITRILPRRRSVAIAASAMLGLVFPMCDCGVVPVMRRLLSKGLPLSCACAYMFGAPLLNPVVLIATWAAFSGDRSNLDGLTSFQMVVLRAALGFITAMILGLIIERQVRLHGQDALVLPLKRKGAGHTHEHKPEHAHKHEHEHGKDGHDHSHCEHDHDHGQCDHEHDPDHDHDHDHDDEDEPDVKQVHDLDAEPERQKKPLVQRFASISETALHDFTDISTYLIIGSGLAAMVQTFKLMDYVPLGTGPVVEILVMMLLAVVICLCSEADAFVAANLTSIQLGGKLAFLVLSPMFDLKLYMMYTRVFKKRFIGTIVISLFVTIFCLSLLTHYLDKAARSESPGAAVPARSTGGTRP